MTSKRVRRRIPECTHKLQTVNIVLIAAMVLHFFITYGVYRWIQTGSLVYALQVLLMILPIAGGIIAPAFIYQVLWAKKNDIPLRSALLPKKSEEKTTWLLCLYIVLFAVLTYIVVCYLNFAVRGIVQFFTKEIALKQVAFTGGILGSILSALVLAALPAAAGEFLNKKIVTDAYAGMGAIASFLLPVLLSLVFYTDIQTLIFRLCYGCAAMIVYKKTNNYLLSALFMCVALLPDAISGGGTWLPLDYRTTLSPEESLVHGLFALGVALTAAAGWYALAHFVFFRKDKAVAVRKKPDYYDVLSLVLIPFAYVLLYLLNVFLFISGNA